jgi:hypothetical protein
MTTRVDDILRRNSLSVTESRKKILNPFFECKRGPGPWRY